MTNERLDELEREMIDAIVLIQHDYQKAIEPYLVQLARIRALRPPTPIVIDLEVARKLGMNV